MLAVYAAAIDREQPLSGLTVGERPEPTHPSPDWTTVEIRAAALNHHDLWSLRGVGLRAEQLPMILGCDGAGVTADGQEVIVHAVIASEGWRGDETLDPHRSLLSERHPGTLAQRVAVPRANLVRKPSELSFAQAACLPTAWLTAYRMLFTRARVSPGQTVLVQGSSGGVSSALIALASHAGVRVWATGRSEAKRAFALELGAERAFEPGARLPERVDAVMDSVGAATFAHSIRSLVPGGTLVSCGATSGDAPSAELTRVFFLQLSVLGATMGTRKELELLLQFLLSTGVRPAIDRVLPLADARTGFEALERGATRGKVVLSV